MQGIGKQISNYKYPHKYEVLTRSCKGTLMHYMTSWVDIKLKEIEL
jgi:hypothetical protein